MLSLRWETFIAFWLRAGKQETYTRSRKFASRQTTGRLRTFILVKTNVFLFWKARSNFTSVMKRSQPGRARSFKGHETLHTVLRTTRNCRLACWGLLPRQDLRISSKNLRDQSRHSIRRRYQLLKTKSINYWRPRRNMAFRFCRRTNESHSIFVIQRRDLEANAVSLRVHRKGNLGPKPRAEAIAELFRSIKHRTS